jgi:hypothetical protein
MEKKKKKRKYNIIVLKEKKITKKMEQNKTRKTIFEKE